MTSTPCIGKKYSVGPKIGRGSFGEIYHGTDVRTNEKVAIKFEPLGKERSSLFNESKVYKALQGGTGIPNMKWIGVEGKHSVLVMDLLGDSLEELFKYCNKTFSLKTVLMLADQMISRIEYVHSKSYLHRDIKPENLLMGLGLHDKEVYIVDFGLAKRCKHHSTNERISCRILNGTVAPDVLAYLGGLKVDSLGSVSKPVGTVRFASRGTHLGIEQSQRDDLESIGYVLMYFLKGSLPWQGQKGRTAIERWKKVGDFKKISSIEALCQGYPAEFRTYFHYCRSMRFGEEPDYDFLKRLFKGLLYREGYKMDYVFDWTILKYQESTPASPPAQSLRYDSGTRNTFLHSHTNSDKQTGREERQSERNGSEHSSGILRKEKTPIVSKISVKPEAATSFTSWTTWKSWKLPGKPVASSSRYPIQLTDKHDISYSKITKAYNQTIPTTESEHANSPATPSLLGCKSSGSMEDYILKAFESLSLGNGKN